MNNEFLPIEGKEDVINFDIRDQDRHFTKNNSMFKLEALLKRVHRRLLDNVSESDWQKNPDWLQKRKKWIEEGIDAEYLKLGSKKWQKGKLRIKISLEFCPAKTENSANQSCLDDIRQQN